MSSELGGEREDPVDLLHVAIWDVEKGKKDALADCSWLHDKEIQVQGLHRKLPGWYTKPELQVGIYGLTKWIIV